MGSGNGNGDGFGGLHRAIQSVAAEMAAHAVGTVTLERCGKAVRVSMNYVIQSPDAPVSVGHLFQSLPPGLRSEVAEVQ